ncbi:hypothetical protein ABE137_12230 [Brevibacillus laterosporus]
MYYVVKATERDGVTPKDGDIGELLAETGVKQRFGLRLAFPTELDDLRVAPYMVLSKDDDDDNYGIRTSLILDVDIVNEDLIIVTTRNTIYFLNKQ